MAEWVSTKATFDRGVRVLVNQNLRSTTKSSRQPVGVVWAAVGPHVRGGRVGPSIGRVDGGPVHPIFPAGAGIDARGARPKHQLIVSEGAEFRIGIDVPPAGKPSLNIGVGNVGPIAPNGLWHMRPEDAVDQAWRGGPAVDAPSRLIGRVPGEGAENEFGGGPSDREGAPPRADDEDKGLCDDKETRG